MMWGKKIFKIVKKEYVESRDCIMIVLDDTLIYKNGSTGIFINVPNSRPFNTYQAGDCLEIDLDRTKYEENKYDICSDTSIVRKVSSSAVISGSSGGSTISTTPSSAAEVARTVTQTVLDHADRTGGIPQIEIGTDKTNIRYYPPRK